MQLKFSARFLAPVIVLACSFHPERSFAESDNRRHPEQSDIADIKRLRDEKAWFKALDHIETLAARFPDDDDLYVLRAHTLSEIGARQKAWDLYRARPQLFSQDEAQRIELDRLAALIGSSAFYDEDADAHRKATLAADAAVNEYLARSGLGAAAIPPRLRNDRILLLNALQRHAEVVDEYDRMRAAGQPVPGYVAATVGDSLLALRRPERAIEALGIATAANPKETNWAVQQAYALSEAERFPPALDTLDAQIAANAPWLRAPGVAQSFPNWRRYDAETNRALVASYGEDLPAAQDSLERMLRLAPDNSSLHSSLGALYARRGWAERGLEQQRIAATLSADNVSARIGQVESFFQLHRSDLAAPLLAGLTNDYPQSRRYSDWNANRRCIAAGGGGWIRPSPMAEAPAATPRAASRTRAIRSRSKARW